MKHSTLHLLQFLRTQGLGNYTFAIRKPCENVEEIRKEIKDNFTVYYAHYGVKLSQGDVYFLYHHHADKNWYGENEAYLIQHSAVDLYLLIGDDVLAKWRNFIGVYDDAKTQRDPKSLRSRFGHPDIPHRNCVHGSSDPSAALMECLYFFG